MSLSSIPWQRILLQSLTAFSLLLGLGVALLAMWCLWPRARRRRHSQSSLE